MDLKSWEVKETSSTTGQIVCPDICYENGQYFKTLNEYNYSGLNGHSIENGVYKSNWGSSDPLIYHSYKLTDSFYFDYQIMGGDNAIVNGKRTLFIINFDACPSIDNNGIQYSLDLSSFDAICNSLECDEIRFASNSGGNFNYEISTINNLNTQFSLFSWPLRYSKSDNDEGLGKYTMHPALLKEITLPNLYSPFQVIKDGAYTSPFDYKYNVNLRKTTSNGETINSVDGNYVFELGFNNCHILEKINNLNFIKTQAVPDYYFGTNMLGGAVKSNVDFDNIDFSAVKYIGKYSFANSMSDGSEIKSMKNLQIIDDYAYQNCTAVYSIINNTINQIGKYAFCFNTSLITINMPNLESTGDFAFYSCNKLLNIYCNNLTSVGKYCFCLCSSLTSISLENLSSIDECGFYGCTELKRVNLPNLKSLSSASFYLDTKINEITFNNLVTIGDFSLYGLTNLKTITLPTTLTSIGYAAFAYSGLTTITFPSNLTVLGSYSLEGCLSLRTIYIESNAVIKIYQPTDVTDPLALWFNKPFFFGGIYLNDQPTLELYAADSFWSQYQSYLKVK